jgi:ribosome biogenesis GTPase / thiamine phosphate phosphatase
VKVKNPEGGKSDSTLSGLDQGLVIAHLGKGLAVESGNGEIVICHTRRRLGDAAVGDRVRWSPIEGSQGRVEEILARRSVLTRPGYAGKLRYVAANLDRVYVVIAPTPEPDWLLVDQYLAACENRGIGASLVLNKMDLLPKNEGITPVLDDFAQNGYPTYKAAAKAGIGLETLRDAFKQQCNMLSGQSGVGKSSLTNALLPDKQLRTSEISEKSGLGRHTTTTATLYHLPSGGDLIDSPGVAVFGLAEMSLRDLAWGYREFQPYIPQCQFNDCRHVQDKGCAVRASVESGQIGSERYMRYLKLLERLLNSSGIN